MDYSVIEVWPSEGTGYLNRTNQRPGMVEPIVSLGEMASEIGGSWDKIIDYHHFQLYRPLAEPWLSCQSTMAMSCSRLM